MHYYRCRNNDGMVDQASTRSDTWSDDATHTIRSQETALDIGRGGGKFGAVWNGTAVVPADEEEYDAFLAKEAEDVVTECKGRAKDCFDPAKDSSSAGRALRAMMKKAGYTKEDMATEIDAE